MGCICWNVCDWFYRSDDKNFEAFCFLCAQCLIVQIVALGGGGGGGQN